MAKTLEELEQSIIDLITRIDTLENSTATLVTQISQIDQKGYDDTDIKQQVQSIKNETINLANQLQQAIEKLGHVADEVREIGGKLITIPSPEPVRKSIKKLTLLG